MTSKQPLDAPRDPSRRRAHKRGPKPTDGQVKVSRQSREPISPRHPVLATFRVADGYPSLLDDDAHQALLEAFAAGRDRPDGFRLVHYGIQPNHFHLLVEAKDREVLSKAMQGMGVRVSRSLNRVWGRTGSVFSDRYHERILSTAADVRGTLAMLMLDPIAHRGKPALRAAAGSSAAWFDGWARKPQGLKAPKDVETPVAPAKTALLKTGWKKGGGLSL